MMDEGTEEREEEGADTSTDGTKASSICASATSGN